MQRSPAPNLTNNPRAEAIRLGGIELRFSGHEEQQAFERDR